MPPSVSPTSSLPSAAASELARRRRAPSPGRPLEAPSTWRSIEARHGSPGTCRASGGMGGPFEAPHLQQINPEWAACAIRRSAAVRLADRNQQRMILGEQGLVRRQVRLQVSARRLVGKAAGHHTMAVQDATGVLVDDEHRPLRRVEQDGVGRLGSDPGNLQEILPQSSKRPASYLREPAVEALEQPRGKRAQASSLEAIGAGWTQGVAQLVRTDGSQPGRTQQAPGTQLADGASRVSPRGELYEDGPDRHLVGGSPRPPALGAEPSLERYVQAQQACLDGVSRRPRDAAPAREGQAS